MDLHTLFLLLIAFLLGRISRDKFYIGTDEKKYKEANWAILLRGENDNE